MVQVRCPQCSSLVEGIEGQEAICGHCGFKALLPVSAAASLTAPATTPRSPPSVSTPVAEPPVAPGPATSPRAAAPLTRPDPATPHPAPVTAATLLSVWGYILGFAALGTFFLARVGLPFAFGLAAVVLSLLARQRDPNDRRALLGLVLGAVAILLALVWLML